MRDDLNKLPLPPEAKAYARRSGLSAMKKQPQSFINMSAAVSNQRDKKHGFKNTDEVGKVPHAIKEAARQIVALILEDEEPAGYFEFKVYPGESGWENKFVGNKAGEVCFNIQLPEEPIGRYVNKIWVRDPLDDNGVKAIEQRMASLAKQRKFPTGSFFETPWGSYLIHGGTIGKI